MYFTDLAQNTGPEAQKAKMPNPIIFLMNPLFGMPNRVQRRCPCPEDPWKIDDDSCGAMKPVHPRQYAPLTPHAEAQVARYAEVWNRLCKPPFIRGTDGQPRPCIARLSSGAKAVNRAFDDSNGREQAVRALQSLVEAAPSPPPPPPQNLCKANSTRPPQSHQFTPPRPPNIGNHTCRIHSQCVI